MRKRDKYEIHSSLNDFYHYRKEKEVRFTLSFLVITGYQMGIQGDSLTSPIKKPSVLEGNR